MSLRRPELQRPPLALALVFSCAGLARAHPGPAAAPEFGPPECITVVDTQKTQAFPIQYFVGSDDTAPEPDHITLPDAKTHQFYAFRGQLSANDPDYALYPFDPALPAPLVVPQWIGQDDLTRSDMANALTIAPDFSAAAIGGDTLQQRADLAGQWQLATPMRLPITVVQSRIGASWDLRMVQPGVYQLVAYIFSPPYNAWEPRPGVIKLVDGVREPPAITLEPVDASLFAGQGRKLTGCVSAPSGSELRAWSRPADDPAAPWQLWATEPLADGAERFELCYRNARPGRTGIVQLRVSARAPSGEETTAYALDQLTLVAKDAPCSESAKLCCEPQATSAAPQGQSAEAAGAPQLAAAGSGAPGGAGTQSLAAGTAAPPTAAGAAAPPPASSGCGVLGARSTRSWPAWLALAGWALSRRCRRSSPTGGRRCS